MKTQRTGLSSRTGRSETGAIVLAASKTVDVSLIAPRVKAFREAHQAYAEAEALLDRAEAGVRAGNERVLLCDAAQDEAVEELARSLVGDRQPRANPFGTFGMTSPSRIKQLPFVEEARTIHKLAAAVRSSTSPGKAARRAAEAADTAAQAIETELAAFDELQAALLAARQARNAAAKAWDSALGVLKRGARAAADDGAKGLYKALFGSLARAKPKPATPAPSASSGTPTPPAPPPSTPATPAANAA
jgi:hypothetical protein